MSSPRLSAGLPFGELRPGVASVAASVFRSNRLRDLSDFLAARLPDSRHSLEIWEPLRTHAPSPALCSPHCCYVRTVVFYHRPFIRTCPHPYSVGGRWGWTQGGFAKFDQVECALSRDDVVTFDGGSWIIGGGRVVWRRKRWWKAHQAVATQQEQPRG